MSKESCCDAVVIAGTTEGKNVIDALNRRGFGLIVCVATPRGKEVLKDTYGIGHTQILVGRRDEEGFIKLLEQYVPRFVVDASHPFAVEVTKNIFGACKKLGIDCVRYVRETIEEADERYIYVSDAFEAVRVLNTLKGPLLLTTGANTAGIYAGAVHDFKRRGYIRVLRTEASIRACLAAGIAPGHVIAQDPPFTLEDNLRLLKQFQIRVLVTKDSGSTGGLKEKLESADAAGVKVIIIRRPDREVGMPCVDSIRGLLDFAGCGERTGDLQGAPGRFMKED